MSLLYITADKIGDQSGGGLVTAQELTALQAFAQQRLQSTKNPDYSAVINLNRTNLINDQLEPWKWDRQALWALGHYRQIPKLAHIYSGTFGETVKYLKNGNCKVVY